MNTNPMLKYDDEIDLHAIFQIIWKARAVILISTLAATLIAYAVSTWMLPKKYQAIAYVTVGQPQVRFSSSNSLLFLPATPDIRALPDLLMADAFLEQVVGDPRVRSLITENETRLTSEMQIDMLGATQLRLQVTDTDPGRAVALANIWAERAADWTENEFGIGTLTATLDTQISQTQRAYNQAQSALETFLAQDDTPVLQTLLTAKNESYICLEKRVDESNAILEHLDEMQKRFVQTDAPLSSSDVLLLVSVQQEVDTLSTTCRDSEIIVSSPSASSFNSLNASQALEIISFFRKRVLQYITSAQEEQAILHGEVLNITVEIERVDYQRKEYTRQRDQAEELYGQLTYQKVLMDGILQQSGRVAQVSIEAVIPQKPSSPRPAVNAAIVGMSMTILVGAIVLLRANWSGPK